MAASPSSAPYEVLSRLGAGGMAEVYLARPVDGGELVALKRVRPEMLERDDVVTQFRREARISSVLKHPSIVSLRAFGEDAEGPWLALEYVHGRALSDLLRVTSDQNRALPLPAALAVCRDIGAALAWAHAWVDEEQGIRGIVHRDVSPDNILISFDGRARLADFGIARWMEATVLTQTGMVKGKLQYLAPELYEGHEADPLTDTFALGATLYTVLAGVRAFSGRNEAEIIRAVQSASPAPLNVLRPELPAALVAWIHGSMEKVRERRPPLTALVRILEVPEAEAKEGDAALARCMQEVFPARAHPVMEESAPIARHTRVAQRVHSQGRHRRWSKRSKVAAVAGAVVVLGAVASGALWWNRQSPHPGTDATPAPLSTAEIAPTPTATASPIPAPTPTVASPATAPLPAEALPVAAASADGAEEKVTLEEPRAAPVRREESSRRRTARSRLAAQKKDAVRAVPQGPGTLWVRAWPWAEVFVDGVPKGRTPLEPFDVPAGSHTVLLVNQSLNETRTMKVRIKPGEQSVLKVVLKTP